MPYTVGSCGENMHFCVCRRLSPSFRTDFRSLFFSLSHAVVGLISPLLCQASVRHRGRGSRKQERPLRERRGGGKFRVPWFPLRCRYAIRTVRREGRNLLLSFIFFFLVRRAMLPTFQLSWIKWQWIMWRVKSLFRQIDSHCRPRSTFLKFRNENTYIAVWVLFEIHICECICFALYN
jgi:hypothetical protein